VAQAEVQYLADLRLPVEVADNPISLVVIHHPRAVVVVLPTVLVAVVVLSLQLLAAQVVTTVPAMVQAVVADKALLLQEIPVPAVLL
jgi:hypothetical protein